MSHVPGAISHTLECVAGCAQHVKYCAVLLVYTKGADRALP